jgi:hypothetical protein
MPGREGAKVELYRKAVRYITVSGQQIGECNELPNIDDLIDHLESERTQFNWGANTHCKVATGRRGINDIIRNGAPEGQRSDAFQEVVWRLANAGLPIGEIERTLAEYPHGIAKKYEGRLPDELERSYRKWLANGGRASPDINNDDDQDEVARPPEYRSSDHAFDWNQPDFSILDDRRGELPEFPLDVLDEKTRSWAERAAHGAGVTPAHVAVPMLGIASSLIGTARRVQASRSFSQPMTTWTALVGFSGTGKTPGIDATKRALAFIDRNRKAKIAELALEHETRVEQAKAEHKAWKKQVEDATKACQPPPPMPASAVNPGEFVAPRLYLSNATIERIAVLLQANPRGLLMLTDELAGLFLNMGRYSGGQDNEFWLEAWNGDSFLVERMGRPPITVDYLLVGVVGGLQPDKVSKCFRDDADGMYARVCWGWPAEPPYRELNDETSEVEPEIVNALSRLIDLPCREPFCSQAIPLSAEARAQLEQLRQFVHATMKGLDGREREWMAKVPAHVLRLAGTLCLLDWAMEGDGSAEPNQIVVAFMSAAIRLVCD